MGFFNRDRETAAASAPDPNAPFQFRVEDMFSVTGRGRTFTGIVEAGCVSAGVPATLVIGDRTLLVTVKRLESRRRKKPSALAAGETGAISLGSISTGDLPTRAHGGDLVVDTAALRGCVIRSRQAADAPPVA